MKAATVLSVLMAGAMSTGIVYAESGTLGKMKERWEQRHAQREEIREKIQGELKKQDADLDKVQGELKSAPEDKKVEALTDAVNLLIDQRRDMHKKMESMGEKMKSAREGLEGKIFKDENGTPGATAPGDLKQPGGTNGGSASPSPNPLAP